MIRRLLQTAAKEIGRALALLRLAHSDMFDIDGFAFLRSVEQRAECGLFPHCHLAVFRLYAHQSRRGFLPLLRVLFVNGFDFQHVAGNDQTLFPFDGISTARRDRFESCGQLDCVFCLHFLVLVLAAVGAGADALTAATIASAMNCFFDFPPRTSDFSNSRATSVGMSAYTRANGELVLITNPRLQREAGRLCGCAVKALADGLNLGFESGKNLLDVGRLIAVAISV